MRKLAYAYLSVRTICGNGVARLMKIDDVRLRLARECINAGGQAAFAKLHGLTKAYVSQVLNGHRPPSDKLCAALGVREDGSRWVKR